MSITVNAVVQEVRKLAREKPDFNYYKQDGLPNVDGGNCSYLAGMTYRNFCTLQEEGKFPLSLTYEEALARGMLGSRCIVGQALHNLGVDDEFLEALEGLRADYVIGALLSDDPTRTQNPDPYLWVASVQTAQDNSITWGESVKIADKEYPNV